jgi:hypothetical protein
MKLGYTFQWLTKTSHWINSRTVFQLPLDVVNRALLKARINDPSGSFFFLADEADDTVRLELLEAIERIKKAHDVVLINTNGTVAIKIFVVDIQ